ncbi:MAG TPA: prepilin-type N-terminal cleavage/methylation domain-containing protein [Tepidisphaeraceae bacterium]|jgi:hypothetical protein
MKRGRAFTLVEMLLAVTISAVLIGGVLAATAALSRDRRRMEARESAAQSPAVTDLVRRDLASGIALIGSPSSEGFELIAFGGVNPKSLGPTQRLARVVYRLTHRGLLIREQSWLDDPIRPDRWSELVATGVKRLELTPISTDAEPVLLGDEVGERLRALRPVPSLPPAAVRVPSRLRVRIEFTDGVVDRELVLR